MQLTTSDRADRFIAAVQRNIDGIIEAGKLAVLFIDEDPEFIDKVCDKCPDITPQFIKKYEAIGRGKLHPRLFINESPGVRRLARLPYSLQEKYSVEPVPLLIPNGETLNVDVRNLMPAQAAQVFGDGEIRSLAQQRAWLEDQAAKASAPPISAGLPYRIVRGEVIFMAEARMKRKELAELLAKME